MSLTRGAPLTFGDCRQTSPTNHNLFSKFDVNWSSLLQESKRQIGGLSVLGVGSMVKEIAHDDDGSANQSEGESDTSSQGKSIQIHINLNVRSDMT